MNKKQKMSDMLKDGVSVNEIESFARKYTSEVFLVLAILIASISSIFDFFSGAGWSIAFAGACAIISILFPNHIEAALRKLFSFGTQNEKSMQIIIGIVRIVLAIFVPFILFGFVGLLAGTSFHIHTRNAMNEKKENKPNEEHKKNSSDDGEHI